MVNGWVLEYSLYSLKSDGTAVIVWSVNPTEKKVNVARGGLRWKYLVATSQQDTTVAWKPGMKLGSGTDCCQMLLARRYCQKTPSSLQGSLPSLV